MYSGFSKADSRNLPAVDNDMVAEYFRNDANFIRPEFRLKKVERYVFKIIMRHAPMQFPLPWLKPVYYATSYLILS